MKRPSSEQGRLEKKREKPSAEEGSDDLLHPELFSQQSRKLVHDYFFSEALWSVNGFAKVVFTVDPECSSTKAVTIWDRSLKSIWENPHISSSQKSCAGKLRKMRRAAVAANVVQIRQLELERLSSKQLSVTTATVGNFRTRDEQWKEAMARYVGEDISIEHANTGDGQEDDGSDSIFNPQLSSGDNTCEFSIASIEPPKRVVRIIGLGEPSSKLHLLHWTIRDEDISRALMESRAIMMKNHETLQRPGEILQLNFIFTRDVILELTKLDIHAEFPAALCKPIQCPQILVCISEVSLRACHESHTNTKKEWRRLEREHLDQCEKVNSTLAELVRSQLEHLLLGADLWSPLQYTARTNNKGNEDSFFCNIVKPLLHAAFGEYEDIKIRGKGDRLSCNPALDKELLFPDYSVTIDCYDKAKGEQYLVICETKPPGASQIELDADYVKLPNMMKLSLNRQIQQGYSEAKVIGILVQGWKVLVFSMCLEHEAIYELKSIGQFDLIMNRMQFCKLINICPILLEAKRPSFKTSSKAQFTRPSYDIEPMYIYSVA
ncbi:hypothetical protein BGW38_001967 [Lunasporangiospora selenospora]|uniref:Uncharacterized protein n=1 Tax=Lunasporangiospora selenospora TaxID=979761 RepID=A0A9P6FTK3_9FUNG|nr:hypothetical protein BGW38_001967 [Lunasporangiospora selenospora]